MTARYGGDTTFSASTSAPSDLTVDPASTSTSLSLSAASATYGDESSITFTSVVTAPVGGTPSGKVIVAAGSTRLCTITLPATTCSASDTALGASATPYAVTATYGGDTNFSGSGSAARDLTVHQATSTTTLSVSATSATYGRESAVTFTATVTPQFTATLTGTVTVAAGSTKLCTFVLPATSCSTTDTALGASATAYPVTAGYGGDIDVAGSTSTTHGLTVHPATTTTSLSLSSTSVAFGNESSLVFTATVGPHFAGTPTGTVTVATGSTTLCTIALPTASTCSPLDTALPSSGTPYAVTAAYGGDTNFSGSTSASQSLTVTAAASTTTLTLSQASVAYGNESAVTFTATVTSGSPGTPTGTVTVAAGSTKLCTITLPATACHDANSVALGASATAYPVVATYNGDANFAGSTSSPRDLTVRSASTTTTLALPRARCPTATNRR